MLKFIIQWSTSIYMYSSTRKQPLLCKQLTSFTMATISKNILNWCYSNQVWDLNYSLDIIFFQLEYQLKSQFYG